MISSKALKIILIVYLIAFFTAMGFCCSAQPVKGMPFALKTVAAGVTVSTYSNTTGAGGHGSNCSISGTNNEICIASGQSVAQFTVTKSGAFGDIYIEIKLTSANIGKTYGGIGVANVDDVGNPQFPTHSWEYGWGYDGNNGSGGFGFKGIGGSTTVYGSLPANGDILNFAIKGSNLHMFAGLNGIWFGSSNPVTDTNPMGTATGTVFYFCSGTGLYSGGAQVWTIQLTPAYTPSGYNVLQ